MTDRRHTDRILEDDGIVIQTGLTFVQAKELSAKLNRQGQPHRWQRRGHLTQCAECGNPGVDVLWHSVYRKWPGA